MLFCVAKLKVARGVAPEVGTPLPRVRAAVDGEPVELDSPLRFRIEPRALRVLVPAAPDA